MRANLAVSRFGWIEHALAFVLPLTVMLRSTEGGAVYGQDVAAVLLLPWLLSRPGAFAHLRYLGPVLAMLLLYLVGQVVTDLIRQTPYVDIVRGWGVIGTLGLQIVVLWLLLAKRWSLFLAYAIGIGIAIIINLFFFSIYFELPWKYGLSLGLALIALGLSRIGLAARRKAVPLWRTALPLLLIGAIALSQAARSVFGQLVLAGIFAIFISNVSGSAWLRRKVTPVAFGGVILGGLLLAQLVISGYGSLANSGALGQSAYQQYIDQSSNDGGILLGGRNESLISLTAIADSPIIGHGSWAKDVYYTRIYFHRLQQAGIPVYVADSDGLSDLIPAHSHLLGAWVWAGILGAAFWAYVLVLAIRAAYYVLRLPDAPQALVALTVFVLAWDILFSPFGAEVRFLRAFQIVLCLAVIMVGRRRAEQEGGASVQPTQRQTARPPQPVVS